MFDLKSMLAPMLKQFAPMIPALKLKHKVVLEQCSSPGAKALALEKAEKDILSGMDIMHVTAEVDGKPIRVLFLGPKELAQKFSLT